LKDLEKFLDLDDEKIYNFYNGANNHIDFKNTVILDYFKNFKIND